MIPLDLQPEEAETLEQVRREIFGSGWRPGCDGMKPSRAYRSQYRHGHRTRRATTETRPKVTGESLLAALAFDYKPGEVVTQATAASAAGSGIAAAVRAIKELKAEGRWPYRQAVRGPRMEEFASCRP